MSGTATTRTRIVELVGLPGTGKTTVVTTLLTVGHGRTVRISLRGWRTSLLLLRNALRVAVPFVHQAGKMGRRRWNRFSLMVRLQTLSDLVSRARAGSHDLILLDQGPVYMLSILQRALQESASEAANSVRFENYWRATLDAWRSKLDCVVLLEARNEVLHDRIHARGTSHHLVDRDAAHTFNAFERSRESRDRLLSALRSNGGPALIVVNTDRLSLPETVESILDQIDRLTP